MTTIERIQWSDDLLTGVDEIDQQHRILVGIIGEAEALLAGERARAGFEQIFRDLLAYAIYHFDTEESLMQHHGYALGDAAAAQAHLEQHRAFSERVALLRGELRRDDHASHAALVAFLHDWLLGHIRNTDKAFGRFVCGSGENSPAA